MPAVLDLVVQNLRAIRSVYSHLKVYRSTLVDGPYVEATTPATRIPIIDQTSAYAFVDPRGSETDFYRFSYFNSKTSAESVQGPPAQAVVDSALEVISVEELKTNYLFGVDLTNDQGDPYPDSLFLWYIRAATRQLELYLGNTPIRQQTIIGERVDYFGSDFRKYQFFKTKWWPIIQIDQVRMVLGADPTIVRPYPASWVRIDQEAGHVELYPSGAGSLSMPMMLGGGLLIPSLFGITGYLPHLMEVDYVAGFPRGQIPMELRHAIGMLAACGPLNIAGDLIAGAGVANYSISLDGLSQSVGTTSSATNAGYGSRIIQYQKDIKTLLPALRAYYNGIAVVAI